MACFLLAATTMNFDGLSPLWLRKVTTYVLATAGVNIATGSATSQIPTTNPNGFSSYETKIACPSAVTINSFAYNRPNADQAGWTFLQTGLHQISVAGQLSKLWDSTGGSYSVERQSQTSSKIDPALRDFGEVRSYVPITGLNEK